jgi:hypothetical protein
MYPTISRSLRHSLTLLAGVTWIAACADQAPVAPTGARPTPVQLATIPGTPTDGMIATLQRVTARYHDLEVARSDGFVLLHDCESRPGEGPVGTVYVHLGRLLDGVIDAEVPDALIYEPQRVGRPKLVGVEFAIPVALAPGQQPPTFLGATFQSEPEFGVYALHAWVWRNNPNGLFAETNPRVSCVE